jgi:hypothetical protein
MAMGPGKYDDLLTEARLKSGAIAAILIIFEGDKGMGFSVQAPPNIVVGIPQMLRGIADSIEEDINNDLRNFPIPT